MKPAAAAAIVFLGGCASFTTMGTATTIEKGSVQAFVAPEAEMVGSETGKPGTLPQLEAGLRYGLTERVEIGSKVWGLGAGLDSKIQLLRSVSRDSGIDLAIDPGLSYVNVGLAGLVPTTRVVSFYLPVLVGMNFEGGHQLVGGARLVEQIAWSEGGQVPSTRQILWSGASLGFAFKISDGFRLMPEVAVALPLVNTALDGSDAKSMRGTFFLQGGLALLFGG